MPKSAKEIWAEIEKVVEVMEKDELVDPAVPPKPIPEPDPSDATVRSIVHKLWQPEQHNGYLGIARSEGVSTGTVKIVERAVLARLQELAPDVEPVIE